MYRSDTGSLWLISFVFYLGTIHKRSFLVFRRDYFNFPRMGFEQNRINRSVFLLRSIQIQDIHFEINPKMNAAFQILSYECKKILLNVKTVNVNFIIRFRRFFLLRLYDFDFRILIFSQENLRTFSQTDLKIYLQTQFIHGQYHPIIVIKNLITHKQRILYVERTSLWKHEMSQYCV